MENDFEVHPRGTYLEIAASRKLANVIEQITRQYGHGIVPHDVWKAYTELCSVYNRTMEEEKI